MRFEEVVEWSVEEEWSNAGEVIKVKLVEVQ